MVCFYSLTTPLGIAIGIGINESFMPNSTQALLALGIIDALAAGILIYDACVVRFFSSVLLEISLTCFCVSVEPDHGKHDQQPLLHQTVRWQKGARLFRFLACGCAHVAHRQVGLIESSSCKGNLVKRSVAVAVAVLADCAGSIE